MRSASAGFSAAATSGPLSIPISGMSGISATACRSRPISPRCRRARPADLAGDARTSNPSDGDADARGAGAAVGRPRSLRAPRRSAVVKRIHCLVNPVGIGPVPGVAILSRASPLGASSPSKAYGRTLLCGSPSHSYNDCVQQISAGGDLVSSLPIRWHHGSGLLPRNRAAPPTLALSAQLTKPGCSTRQHASPIAVMV